MDSSEQRLSWTDAAGRTVEYVVFVMPGDTDRTKLRAGSDLPFDGPGFRVTEAVKDGRVTRGYARTEGQLRGLGVSSATIAAIEDTIRQLTGTTRR